MSHACASMSAVIIPRGDVGDDDEWHAVRWLGWMFIRLFCRHKFTT